MCVYIIYKYTSVFEKLIVGKSINAYFLYDFREELVKVSKESKQSMSYSGRVKTLCLQKNTALWIGTGGGYVLLVDLSTRRVVHIIHNFYDSVRVMMTAQLGKLLSFPSFFMVSKTTKICLFSI